MLAEVEEADGGRTIWIFALAELNNSSWLSWAGFLQFPNTCKRHQGKTAAALEALLPAVLERAFQGEM
ncbi:MAG: hypothetical protein ACP5OU_06810 [Methanothrix sp.]